MAEIPSNIIPIVQRFRAEYPVFDLYLAAANAKGVVVVVDYIPMGAEWEPTPVGDGVLSHWMIYLKLDGRDDPRLNEETMPPERVFEGVDLCVTVEAYTIGHEFSGDPSEKHRILNDPSPEATTPVPHYAMGLLCRKHEIHTLCAGYVRYTPDGAVLGVIGVSETGAMKHGFWENTLTDYEWKPWEAEEEARWHKYRYTDQGEADRVLEALLERTKTHSHVLH